MLRFDLLRTPPGDGDTLIEPAVSRWLTLIDDNVRLRKRQVMTLAVNPRFDSLRDDPRFDEFLERVGLPRVGRD